MGDDNTCTLSDFALLTNEPIKSMNFPETIVTQWETLTNSIAAFEYQLEDYKVITGFIPLVAVIALFLFITELFVGIL